MHKVGRNGVAWNTMKAKKGVIEQENVSMSTKANAQTRSAVETVKVSKLISFVSVQFLNLNEFMFSRSCPTQLNF